MVESTVKMSDEIRISLSMSNPTSRFGRNKSRLKITVTKVK